MALREKHALATQTEEVELTSLTMCKGGLDEPTGVWRDADSYFITPDKKPYTWEEINAIEVRRRAILRRSELPFWKVLGFWDGTCLRALYTDWLLWVTVAVYISIRIQARFDETLPVFVRYLGNTDIDVIGGFLSFFLVFFVNQSNSRFNEMYHTSMAVSKRIYDVASLVVTTLPKHSAQRIVRYMNAAHAAGYVGVSKTYSKQEFFDHLDKKCCFLTKQEMTRIRQINMNRGPDACHELLQWCMIDIQQAWVEEHVSAREAGVLKEKILSLRGSMGTLYDFSDQPVHFFYIHFLCLLSALYLPLFAVDNAYSAGTGDQIYWSSDVVSGLIVILQSIFVIGLRVLGQKMVDPYGDDLEDLSVLYYIESTWLTSNRILATQFPGDVIPEDEEGLDRDKKSIGKAWEPYVETGLNAA